MTRFLSIIILVLATTLRLSAQQLAYVYIQGDKHTPFYVKLEGAMQERYGKNYCILSQMAPGPTRLEILFQQNVFPAQKFLIQVPEGGSRGFLLVQKNGAFSLYDLQQHFYLPAGNREDEDHLPAEGSRKMDTLALPVADLPEAEAPVKTVKKQPSLPKITTPKWLTRKKDPAPKAIKKPVKTGTDPQFLQNIELNNGGNNVASTPELADDSKMAPPVKLSPTFRNSDCPQAMDSAVFERLYKQMMVKNTDEDRIDFLNGQMDKCFMSWHARVLGSLLTEDAARYTFLKNVYPRIVDQQEFPLLDDMLRSEVWKNQFLQIVHP